MPVSEWGAGKGDQIRNSGALFRARTGKRESESKSLLSILGNVGL